MKYNFIQSTRFGRTVLDMLRWFRNLGQISREQQVSSNSEILSQQRIDVAELKEHIYMLIEAMDHQKNSIESLNVGLVDVANEMRIQYSEILRAIHHDAENIQREQDATGRQLIRRLDEAAIVVQQQFAQIIGLSARIQDLYKEETDRILERADEAVQFYDGITMFMRNLPQLVDSKTAKAETQVTLKESNQINEEMGL